MMRHYFLALLPGLVLMGAPVELGNSVLRMQVNVEQGGKVILLESQSASISCTLQDQHHFQAGLSKERLFGDSWELAEAPWKILEQKEDRLRLQLTGVLPHPQLEITKEYSLPSNAAWVRIEINFRNRSPVADDFSIIPWLHHSLPFSEQGTERNDNFYFSHQNGVEEVSASPPLTLQPCLQQPGNWMAYWNPEKQRGLLVVAEKSPELQYGFISPKAGTLEMLYARVKPVPESRHVYYMAPLCQFDAGGIAALRLPVALNPAWSDTSTPGSKTSLFKHFQNPEDAHLTLDCRFWKERAYLSPELPLPLTFGIRNSAPANSVLELEVDLPEFVELRSWVGDYWGMQNEKLELSSKEKTMIGGRNYLRCRFRLQARRQGSWLPNHCRLLLQAREAGLSDIIHYRTFVDNRQIVERSVPCEVIHMPKTSPPENFRFWFGIDYALIKAWPDFINNMKHLGFNGLCLNSNVPNSLIRSEQVRELNQHLRENGLSPAIMGIYFNKRRLFHKDNPAEDFRCLDIDDKYVSRFDFSRRGPWMQEVAQYAVDRGLNLGFDLAISDYEPYSSGQRISFTDTTIQAFREMMLTKHPGTVWVDPKEIARNPEKYPHHFQLWTDFKCAQFASYIEEVVEMARQQADSATQVGWCTIPGLSAESIRQEYLMDNTRFSRFLDFNMPMLYNNVYRSMPNFRHELKLFQEMSVAGRARVAPTLTTGFWGENNQYPSEHTLFILLETALLQCAGVYLFPGFAGSSNLDLYYLGQALSLIAGLDSFLAGAERQEGLVKVVECRNDTHGFPAQVQPLVLVNGEKMLLYLAEYSSNPVTLKVEFELPGDCRVTVLHGDSDLTRVDKRQQAALTLTSGRGKGLLLMLESLDGTPFCNFGAYESNSEIPLLPDDYLLYEPFDGSSQGRNGVPGHFFSYDSAGYRGPCLALQDYESSWVWDEELPVPSGELKIGFYYKLINSFLAGKPMKKIISGNLGRQWDFQLFLHSQSGKMGLALRDLHNKEQDYSVFVLSGTSGWPGQVWLKIDLHIGSSGVRLLVNNKEECRSGKPVLFQSLSELQLGGRWHSTGRYDELLLEER